MTPNDVSTNNFQPNLYNTKLDKKRDKKANNHHIIIEYLKKY